MKRFICLMLLCGCIHGGYTQMAGTTISSPDGNIVVTCDAGKGTYAVSYKGAAVLRDSKLGLIREDGDFSQNLQVVRVSSPVTVTDRYSMLTAKKATISYQATQRVIETKIASGGKMNIIFQVSNDGLAFRYAFPEKSEDVKKIRAEATSFHFPEGTRAWLQPKTEAQTGFEHSNPSYEAHYSMDIPAGTPSPGPNGWIYPALFRTGDVWMLITEAALGRTYCGTALQQYSTGSEYRINFPEPPEVFTNGKATLNPESTLPWQTPWRIIVIGDLKTVAESTLGTDLALPAKAMDHAFIKPGKASWSWILKKDDSTVYSVQKRYIDYAADMKWQYCLIDANWDATIGYDSVRKLADYAKRKNVGLLLWYNSAGSWNTVKFTPRDKLLTHESRVKEFSRLAEMGIKGIKVDFFGGDGQSMINYYQDILDDAAASHLLVNFHGATLPRGLQRTYPNLVTTEAVFGYEMITFSQQAADRAPDHSVMCAFVRNAFDPMDFTPMCLYKIPHIRRVTTPSFELATSVVFLSGIQHYAESPDGMEHVPGYVKDFLRGLPDSWDDVKFLGGYPGKLFVVARRAGRKWYVAGINGEKVEKPVSLDLSFLKNKRAVLITTGDTIKDDPSFETRNIVVPAAGKMDLTLKGNDGFVMVVDDGAVLTQRDTQPAVMLRLDQPGHAVSPKLYGLMTEEINYSYDGGLYGELIRNRAFRNNPMTPDNWSLVEDGGAKGVVSLDRKDPVNQALPVSLRLEARETGARIGIANEGYWGIPVRPKTAYSVSFYAKAARAAALAVSIESRDGRTIYASAVSPPIGSGWQQYRLTLTTADDIAPTADTRFVVAAKDTGTYWFNLVSLFPPTYNNTPNGNRPDIMQLLADMKPAFLRFPGGNYLEGDYFSSRFDWKKTIGSLDQRPGHPGPWGYRSTDGMGLYEFLMWCEDLKMEPLLAVFAGYTLKGDYFDDPRFLQPFIDEALEEIEYVTGDKSTKWGAVRARDGHPAPFPLTYVEIGNEDGFDRSGSYGQRFDQFAAAIRARYPQLKIISTVGGRNDWLSARYPLPKANADLVDEHFYRSAIEMQEMATLYDNYDRKGPKVFVGEWASREGFPTTNLNAALGDAAFLTGLERNSDLVVMSCYAPLFVNVNPGGMQWKSDLIGYNTLSSFGSPSYYVQKMFSNNTGDQTVAVEVNNLPTQLKKPNSKDSARGVQPVTIPAMFFSATKDSRTGAVFLKVVNASPVAQELNIGITGSSKVESEGKAITIGSDNPENTNSITEPEKVVPLSTPVKGLGKHFRKRFSAWSVTVLQLQLR